MTMKKILAVLLLLPCLVWADALVYEALTVAEVDKDNVATGKRVPKQTFFGFSAETGTAK